MSVQNLAGHTAPPAPRLISLIGLTLALAFIVVLAGAWLAGTWLTGAQGQPIANDFVDVWAAGVSRSMVTRLSPMTGRCTKRRRCARSVMILKTIMAGITRRHSSLPRLRWLCCPTRRRRSSGLG